MSNKMFIGTVLGLSVGGVALALPGAASAQMGPPAAPAAPANPGGIRPQDVAAANRQVDSDYNTLASRGVKVTDKNRAEPNRKHASAVPATAADMKPGAPVRDINGVPVGKIAILGSNEVVADPNEAVVDTGQTKIAVPLSAFGKDDKGLMLSVTAAKFNQLVAQAHASAQAQPTQPNR